VSVVLLRSLESLRLVLLSILLDSFLMMLIKGEGFGLGAP